MFDRIGGRKLVATATVLAIAVGITLYRGDVPSNLLTLLMAVFGAFVVGNGIEHVADAMQGDSGVSANTVAESGKAITEAVGKLSGAIAEQHQALDYLVQSQLAKQQSVKNQAQSNRKVLEGFDPNA